MEELKRAIRAYCEENRIMGVLQITQGDRVLLKTDFGYADRERKKPFDAHSRFAFYSLSKPFCAIAFMLLRERGLVSLTDHPGKILPEAKGFHEKVNFRHILTHTSGLPDPALDHFLPPEATEARRGEEILPLLPAIAARPSAFAPGEGQRYSNINFVLTALVIEKITGEPYHAFLRREVLLPFGMTASSADPDQPDRPENVQGYELREGALSPVERGRAWMLGAGDILGTADDVYCLHRALRDKKLLSEESWREILTPAPQNFMGLGCCVKPFLGRACIRHNGGSAGFRTLHRQFPEDDLGVVFLSNSGFGDARKAISEMIVNHVYGKTGSASDDVPMDAGYIPG